MSGPLPAVAPADGVAVVPEAPPGGDPGAWIVVGPRTRAHLARVLEQQSGAGLGGPAGDQRGARGAGLAPGGGRVPPRAGTESVTWMRRRPSRAPPTTPASRPRPTDGGAPTAGPTSQASLRARTSRRRPCSPRPGGVKTALAVGFVLVWMIVSLYDWLSEPGALVVPAWFSALGAFLLLVVLLGIQPWGVLRRR